MFELYREAAGGGVLAPDDAGEATTGTELVLTSGDEPVAAAKWRWQLVQGDKVIARSEESWTKRSAALAGVKKARDLVANAGVVEKLA